MSNTLNTDVSNRLAVDSSSLNDIKAAANQNTPEGIKGAATQFEALFVNMMLKSMREATPQDGPLDSQQSKMYTGMLDQQLSQKIAERGLGLAQVLAKQMMENAGFQYTSRQSVAAPTVGDATTINQHAQSIKAATPGISSSQAQVKAFQSKLTGYAHQASQSTGIPAKFMLGQAALESGWGKHEIPGKSGQPSYNIFGIKANSEWKGKTVSAVTTEYCNGVPTQKIEKFRCYDNYGEAFNDYAKLLQGNQRYKDVIANSKDVASFAHGLQRAGYASDPHYANKLMNVITKTLST